MARVLVVCAEPVGPLMAGPAIRARELARVLAADHEVTLAAPAPSVCEDRGVTLLKAGFEDYDALRAAVAAHDVVVAQRLPTRLLATLPGLGTRLVADLYNPVVFEVLEASRGKPDAARRRQQRTTERAAIAHLAAADHVVCASEQQRDLWLGMLAAAGLVDLAVYDRDPSLRSVIDVVPFGLPAEPPAPGTPPLPIRARFPAIAPKDRIVLWGGGAWTWLDPETVVDAVGLVEARRTDGPRTHLVIMGLGRPGPEEVEAMTGTARLLTHLERTGLEGAVVHVNRGWLPYAERGGWLLEADLGVSAHHDHLETRFAFRTRILDCLWAGLPVVATRGDALAALVAAEGLGLTVPARDPAAFADALAALLDDPARRGAAVAAIRATAPRFTWERAVAPLSAFCAGGTPGATPDRGTLRRATLAQYPALLADTRERLGVRGALARAWRNARRALTPGR